MEAPCSRFTAAEGGARLAAVAGMKNTLAVEYASFISTRMIYEHAYKIRGSLFEGQQRSVYVSRATRVDVVAYELTILTDLNICKALKYDDVYDWYAELDAKEVLVCTSEVLKQILEEEILSMPNINVLVLDSCHLVSQDANLQYIMKQYKACEENVRPRILALTYPLFSTPKKDDQDTNNDKNDNDKTSDNISKSEENLTKTEENLPTSEENLPKSEHNLPTSEENLPTSEQSLPTTEQNLRISEENLTLSEQKLPNSEQNLPKTEENMPRTEQKLPKVEQSVTKSKENLPKAEENMPRSEQNLTKTEENQPTSEQNLPKVEHSVTKSEKNEQETAENVTKAEEHLPASEQNLPKIEEKLPEQQETTTTTEDIEVTRKNQINIEPLGVYENLDDFAMYEKLEWKIEQLENELCSQMDLAEDIDGGKRLSASLAKPKELIIEYSAQPSPEKLPEEYLQLEYFMRDTVCDAMVFLNEHRYDPTEIYGEDLYEEFKNIPDPTIEPKYIFKQFLYVLEQLGPYAADKAAFSLLTKLEKLKIKVPYERHFLLLCLCTSVFVKIRCHAELIFSKYESDWEKIKKFCTPKVLRFAEILEKFCPPDHIKEIEKKIANSQNNDDNIDKNKVSENSSDKNNENSKSSRQNDNILNEENDNVKNNDDEVTDNVKNNDDEKSVEDSTVKNDDNSRVRTEDKNDNNKSVENNDNVKNTDSNCDTIKFYNKNKINKTSAMLESIEQCDFKTLSNKIEDRVNTYEANLKDLEDYTVTNYYNNTSNVKNECHDGEINQTDDKSSSNDVNSDSNNVENSDINNSNNSEQNNIENSDINNVKIRDSENMNNVENSDGNNAKNSDNYTESNDTNVPNPSQQDPANIFGIPKRTGQRTRGRGRPQRSNQARNLQMSANPDALCGIVYMKEPLVAKIMFMIIVDMSRANPSLSYLCGQYCAVESPTELRECQRQGRRQEDVLKKFRMHECNLLLATSALEEGIDLPRCNLVLRWDVPNSYRSYGLCRSRARASRASCAVLSCAEGSQTDKLLQNVAVYRELDQIISRKCGCGIQDEPPQSEEDHADSLAHLVKPYTPFETSKTTNSSNQNDSNITENITIDNNDPKNIDNNKKSSENKDNNTKTDKTSNSDDKNKHNNTNNENVLSENSDNNKNSTENNKSATETDIKTNSDNKKQNTKDEDTTNISENNKNSTENNKSDTEKDIKTNSNNKNQNTKDEDATNISENIDNNKNSTEINKSATEQDNKTNSNNKKQNTKDEDATNISENIDNNKNSTEINKSATEQDIKTNSDDKNQNKNTKNTTDNSQTCDNAKSSSENNVNNTKNVDNNCDENSDNISELNNEIKTRDIVNTILKINNEINDLICNKCNNKHSSVNKECPCVLSDICVNISSDNKVDKKSDDTIASVDLNSAIALINRYCGKLPSDTFTRLAPQWWTEKVSLPVNKSQETKTAYICTLRLPLNCPLKYNIVGHPMPTKVLARRMVALQACRILHKSGELDNQLMPIGKENFSAGQGEGREEGEGEGAGRPGTTKRRQYYFKRTASVFTNCQPIVDTSDSEIDPPNNQMTSKDLNTEPYDEMNKDHIGASDVKTEPHVQKDAVNAPGKKRNMLYAIVSKLWCALPERYNTRGRRLHVPQNASQAIGILMAREQPENLQIPAFPVYTRSGEVRVSVEYVPDADVRMSPRRGRLVRRFMRFVFTEVLRVRRRGMKLQSEGSTQNNYYIVPTIKTTRDDGTTKIDIDWAFLELIYQHTEEKKQSEVERPSLWQNDEEEEEITPSGTVTEKEKKPGEVKEMKNPLLKEGETFVFSAEKYREAVVTPWYRNQDQPQFFLVAEICWNLSPDSEFPSATHTTFRQYYKDKYGVTLTQTDQPLLDVDHTSNRLNLLTPRYVNRKGVALPVSSERTRRAKRDRLDQKQILVPELCRVHPFAAPLWFATVALPCVLYRINALLIADEIRRAVAIDVGLGIPRIDETTCPGFQWPPLDFGWSLSEVLNADAEKNKDEKKREEDSTREDSNREKEEEDQQPEKTEKAEDESPGGCKEKTINDILQEKELAENGFEIGTWSNEMASSIPQSMEYDEFMEPLPANLTFCTSASGGVNWCDPVEKPKREFQPSGKYSMADSDCSYMSSDFDTDDSELNSEGSDEDTDSSGFFSSKNSNAAMGVRIEYKTAHEAEAVDLENTTKVCPAPQPDEADDALDRKRHEEFIKEGHAPKEYIEKFHQSVLEHKREIIEKGLLIKQHEPLVEILPETTKESHEKLARNSLECKSDTRSNDVENSEKSTKDIETNLELTEISNKLFKDNLKMDDAKTKLINELFPYGNTGLELLDENGQICLEKIEKNKRVLLEQLKQSLPKQEIKKLNCFSMKDVDIDSPNYVNEKIVNIGFDTKKAYEPKVNEWKQPGEYTPYYMEKKSHGKDFDFDYQPKLEGHPGPSPSVILQALTMSNANDGINLERLETIGDSFLKFAITAYLYCAHPTVHEGKLSHMRSKQVSNLNLYRLGRMKRLGARMIASKFEPHDNWLPPCHKPPSTLHPREQDSNERSNPNADIAPMDSAGCFIPYNLITQHSIPDKSIADCVEALIGAYLLECGPRGALLFMSWLGIKVLPKHDVPLSDHHPYVRWFNENRDTLEKPQQEPPPPTRHHQSDSDSSSSDDEEHPCGQSACSAPPSACSWPGGPVGALRPHQDGRGHFHQTIFGELKAPPSPLLRYIEDPEGELEQMLSGYDALERTLQYRFKDRSLLLQALTHASHQQNRLTDCYQRLEFLGDAILDYLITRHLYEDPRRHSPGALTDLRSALVNNTIFATLAARHGFHKYFRHMAPGLNEVLTKYVRIQEENGHSISEEHYLIQEDEMEQAEDVEVPKALGDLFESVAGAVFLDSGMSLGAVWKSYVNLMGAELEAFSAAAPKSPVRELLEAEPDTAKFGKPERLADGRRVRVCVEVFGRGAFKGIGRNYRIAKGTAARCALRHLRGRRPKGRADGHL